MLGVYCNRAHRTRQAWFVVRDLCCSHQQPVQRECGRGVDAQFESGVRDILHGLAFCWPSEEQGEAWEDQGAVVSGDEGRQ